MIFFSIFLSHNTWDASGNIAQACLDIPRILAGTCFIKILQKMKHFLKPTELCQRSQTHLNQPHRSWRALHTLELLVPTAIKHCVHFSCYRSDHHFLWWYQYHQDHHDTCEAQAQVMFSAAVMLVSKPKIGTPVSFATHLYWLKRNIWNLSQIRSNFSADTPAGTTAQTLLRLKHSLGKTIPRKLFPRYKKISAK